MSAIGVDGTEGYVKEADINAVPQTLEEALEYTPTAYEVPLYEEDGETVIGTFIFVLPTSIISAMIAAVVFGGVTSSGSAYIVQALEVLSIGNLLSNIFLTQIVTDYADKLLGVTLVKIAVNAMPKGLKRSFSISK